MSSTIKSAQYSSLSMNSANDESVTCEGVHIDHNADRANGDNRAVDQWIQKDLNTQLLSAIVANELSTVAALLQQGAHPNTTCRSYKFTAVHLAVLVGSEEVLHELLTKGATCTEGDRHGLTPLHYASYYSHDRCMEILLRHVDPRHSSSNFINAAAEQCTLTVLDSVKDSLDHTCYQLEDMLPKDIAVGCSALHVACQKVHAKCVEIILRHKPSMHLKDNRDLTAFEVIGELLTVAETSEPDFIQIINTVQFFGGKCESMLPTYYCTPLHAAVTLASRTGIKLLLDCGLHADLLDENGETPVHLAIQRQGAVALKTLLDCTPDVSMIRNAMGLTPFQAAVERQWVHGIGMLLSAHANVTEVAADGRTVLHVAAAAGNVDLLEELFQLDDVHKILNTKNNVGETPIYCAISSGKLDCVRFLINKQVDITVRLKGNINVLHRAAEQGDADILAALLHVDRTEKCHLIDELDTLDFSGMTPLHTAAWNNQLACVRQLIEYNCHYTKRTAPAPHCGSMAVHLACTRDHSAVLACLLDHDHGLVALVDNSMRNPLHCAALQGSRQCIEILLNAGSDLASMYIDETALDIIFRNVSRPTDFLETMFDARISVDDKRTLITDKTCMVNINFNILIPRADNQMEILSNILHNGRGVDQRKLLLHPLIECFLHLKWEKMRNMFWALLLCYALFVLFLTMFAMSMFYFNSAQRPTMLYHVEVIRSGLVLFLILVSALEFLLVVQTGQLVKINLDRGIKWLSLILVAVLIWTPSASTGDDSWLRHIATLAVLTAWIQVMFLLSKVPKWGYYVQMFFKVSKNVLKVMAIFSVLVIGFALAFMIEFQCVESFAHPFVGFIKTIVMMTSELDYSGIFTEANRDNAQVINLTIYLVFLVLASIVLMNLMVGLAVSDIHDLEIIGKIDRHAQQIEFLSSLETATMAKYLPRQLRQLSARNYVESTLKVYPAHPKCTIIRMLPGKLKESILDIAEDNVRRGSEVTPAQLLDKMDSIVQMIEQLQRQLPK